MITILLMRRVMNPASFVVDNVGGYNAQNCWYQQPVFILNQKKFQHQKQKTCGENNHGRKTVVMSAIAMVKRINADGKSQNNHKNLEADIFYNIKTKHGQTCK